MSEEKLLRFKRHQVDTEVNENLPEGGAVWCAKFCKQSGGDIASGHTSIFVLHTCRHQHRRLLLRRLNTPPQHLQQPLLKDAQKLPLKAIRHIFDDFAQLLIESSMVAPEFLMLHECGVHMRKVVDYELFELKVHFCEVGFCFEGLFTEMVLILNLFPKVLK